jgi:hypothetical protein
VDGSPLLQYLIELGILGRAERPGVPASLPVHERLRLLHEDVELRSRGRYRCPGVVKNSPQSIDVDLLLEFGIFAAPRLQDQDLPEYNADAT